MGAHPVIRNPENKKLRTLLGSFTLTSSDECLGESDECLGESDECLGESDEDISTFSLTVALF